MAGNNTIKGLGIELPRYVGRGGEQAARPPMVGIDTRMYNFVVPADEDALVDRIDFGARPYAVDLRTQSDARSDTLLKISDFGWVTGSLKLRLVSGDFQSTLQVPF